MAFTGVTYAYGPSPQHMSWGLQHTDLQPQQKVTRPKWCLMWFRSRVTRWQVSVLYLAIYNNEAKHLVDPWLTEKRVDRKKTTVDRIRVVLQKGYVLYGITATLELVYRFLRRVDRMEKIIFRFSVNAILKVRIVRKSVHICTYKTSELSVNPKCVLRLTEFCQ